jgi:hypothetical protein
MKSPEKAATLRLEIPNRVLASDLLERWSEKSGVTLNVLRGRVTPEKAAYELEIRGSAPTVARIVRQCAPWDVARRFLNPSAEGALA